MAEVLVSKRLFQEILERIHRLKPVPLLLTGNKVELKYWLLGTDKRCSRKYLLRRVGDDWIVERTLSDDKKINTRTGTIEKNLTSLNNDTILALRIVFRHARVFRKNAFHK